MPPDSVPVPSVAAPSMKVTIPVGTPGPGPGSVTVAVNVTDWPYTAGLGAADTVVVVIAKAAENSDVFPAGSVAVAVKNSPTRLGVARAAEKLALPLLSV